MKWGKKAINLWITILFQVNICIYELKLKVKTSIKSEHSFKQQRKKTKVGHFLSTVKTINKEAKETELLLWKMETTTTVQQLLCS